VMLYRKSSAFLLSREPMSGATNPPSRTPLQGNDRG
jgi:hypothetical protein